MNLHEYAETTERITRVYTERVAEIMERAAKELALARSEMSNNMAEAGWAFRGDPAAPTEIAEACAESDHEHRSYRPRHER